MVAPRAGAWIEALESTPNAAIGNDSAPASNPPYVMDGPVAIIPVKGALSKNGLEFWGIQWLASMRAIASAIMQAADDPNVCAIMLDVESPGGTVDGVDDTGGTAAECMGGCPRFS